MGGGSFKSAAISHSMPWENYKLTWIGGKRQYLHRYLMEQHLGRELLPEEIVSFFDGDSKNVAITNLVLMTREELAARTGGRRKAVSPVPSPRVPPTPNAAVE